MSPGRTAKPGGHHTRTKEKISLLDVVMETKDAGLRVAKLEKCQKIKQCGYLYRQSNREQKQKSQLKLILMTVLKVSPDYDSRLRPWYTAPVALGGRHRVNPFHLYSQPRRWKLPEFLVVALTTHPGQLMLL